MDFMRKTTDRYHRFLEAGDARVQGLPLMSSPLPTLLILVCYYIFVYYGRTIMADRKPLQLKRLIMLYNLGMVIFSLYMAKEFAMAGWLTGYQLGCQPIDYTPRGDRMAIATYLFFISKIIELTDTIIFIMKKKFHQLTFLHLFHHGFLPFNWWFGIKFIPGGWGTFHAFINTLVHSVMYMYYFLSAGGPAIQKYLWWKKYITTIQIAQFILVICHTLSTFLFVQDCDYPSLAVKLVLFYNFLFLCLFMDFYIKTYKRKTKPKENDKIVYMNGHGQKVQNGHMENGNAVKVD
ncbi:elongation of very long chain fatty acids protein 1-like [Mizuhopecten yessoensis]|uniref:elongation of very long chain fatty acids protein 1-like n=1 Tax=Mizuhopecten yessoensis TaxID=6573 RepID=UPI000B4598DD|nr:elongation of very long chain fatty acids protein 1-like [Mizuhopecten yessoensis]